MKKIKKELILSKLPRGGMNDKTYWLTVSHVDEVTTFKMHLAQIGATFLWIYFLQNKCSYDLVSCAYIKKFELMT